MSQQIYRVGAVVLLALLILNGSVVGQEARSESVDSVRSQRFETEPNNDSSTANGLDIMIHQEGSLPSGDPADWFFFDADADDLLVVIMDDDPDDDGILLDTDVAIIAGDGTTILAEGDNGDGDGNCLGALAAPVRGNYYVRVSDGGSGGGDIDYRFVLLINGVLVPVELQGFAIE